MSQDRSSRRRPPASRRKTAARPDLPSRATAAAHKPSQKTAAQRELTTKRRGELAELAFALKAASLGFGVSRPWGDSERYDFILDADDLHPYRLSDCVSPSETIRRAKRTGARTRPAAEAKAPKGVRTACVAETPAPKGQKNAAHGASGGKDTANQSAPAGRKKRRATKFEACPLPLASPPRPLSRLWRVQVKGSTHLNYGLYFVNCGRHCNGRIVSYSTTEIDFFAAYVIPEDTWYILPVQLVVGRTSVLFRRRGDPKPGLYDAYREAWHLLRQK